MGMLGRKIVSFYAEGFRTMQLGRTLWAVILIKLVLIFAVLRLFFFSPVLQGSDEEKGETVSGELIQRISTDQH